MSLGRNVSQPPSNPYGIGPSFAIVPVATVALATLVGLLGAKDQWIMSTTSRRSPRIPSRMTPARGTRRRPAMPMASLEMGARPKEQILEGNSEAGTRLGKPSQE